MQRYQHCCHRHCQTLFQANNIHHTNQQSESVNLREIILRIYPRAVCHSTEALEHIVYFFGLYAIACLVVYVLIFQKWLTQWYRHATNVRLPNSRRVLICIAHPDDESMFFGPTILSLTKRTDCQVYLLCLSNGLLKMIRMGEFFFCSLSLSVYLVAKDF